MADSFLPYKNPDTTDAKLDSESLTVGSDTVERERIQIAGKGAAEIAEVKNAPPAKDHHGVVTRPVKTGVILATVSDAKTATGVVGSQQDIGAKSLTLQLTGTWVGTVIVEQSNDNTNWVGTILYDVAGSVMGGSGGVFTGITLNGIFIANIRFYFSINNNIIEGVIHSRNSAHWNHIIFIIYSKSLNNLFRTREFQCTTVYAKKPHSMMSGELIIGIKIINKYLI